MHQGMHLYARYRIIAWLRHPGKISVCSLRHATSVTANHPTSTGQAAAQLNSKLAKHDASRVSLAAVATLRAYQTVKLAARAACATATIDSCHAGPLHGTPSVRNSSFQRESTLSAFQTAACALQNAHETNSRKERSPLAKVLRRLSAPLPAFTIQPSRCPAASVPHSRR